MKRPGSIALVVTAGVLARLVQLSAVDVNAALRIVVIAVALVGAGVLGWCRPHEDAVHARTEP